MTTEKIRKRFTADDLQELVEKAQAYDQQAIDALCAVFAPLICKECAVSYVQSALGADAQNIAWEIFLDFIYHYDGTDYKRLPGFIKMHLHYSLLHQCDTCKTVEMPSISDDAILEIPDKNTHYEMSYEVQDALNHLTAKQRAVIEAVYFQGYTLKEFCGKHDICRQTAAMYRIQALKELKNIMQNK